jgi:anti-sigma regulatory factor (Ser/Thr protein kinase)
MDMGLAPGLSVRLAADPVGVPAARRFVVEGFTAWGQAPLADVAELVVSEFAGNAALHSGGDFMYVSMVARPDGAVRVAVEDDGPVGPEAVMPHAPPDPTEVDNWMGQATTGRGLAIVSVLAAEWGVEGTPRGKRVWADLVDPDAVNEVRPPQRGDAPVENQASSRLPPGWVLVRLAGCPVELSLRQDQHLDELVRELQLLTMSPGRTGSREIASQISALLTSPAHARLTGRRIAEQARSQGLRFVDIDMAMPREFSGLVEQLEAAVSRADLFCEQDQLLALASPPDLRELRAWMTHQIVAQSVHDEAPTPWTSWLFRSADATDQQLE